MGAASVQNVRYTDPDKKIFRGSKLPKLPSELAKKG